MGANSLGILDSPINDTPFAVLDLETTGLTPGLDRIVEVSVVRMEPGAAPTHVLDTLVNPRRPVTATEIHGITDSDVADAPTFDEIAGDIVRAVSGCVVAAYNIYFDIRFLTHELAEADVLDVPPHLCLMYLRPMLGLGNRCRLPQACAHFGVSYSGQHEASADAAAAAQLMCRYLEEMEQRRIGTFGDLARLREYKFVESFANPPLPVSLAGRYDRCRRLKPRHIGMREAPSAGERAVPAAAVPPQNALVQYWEALKVVVADLRITPEEMEEMREMKLRHGFHDEQVRMLHARLFSAVISEFIDDKWLDAKETRKLHRLHAALHELGWAPGDPLASKSGEGADRAVGERGGLPLAGKTIVVTGTLASYTRSQVKQAIKRSGGRAAASVSAKTDFVLVGKDPGSKADEAKALGVTTIDEQQFRKMIGEA